MTKQWAPGTREERIRKINEGIQRWLASLTPEQKEERRLKRSRISKEKWAKAPQAQKEEIVEKIQTALIPQREALSQLKKNWWETATEEQKAEARRKMAEARREWWRAMSDEARKAAIDKIHQKQRDRKAARELLGAVPVEPIAIGEI